MTADPPPRHQAKHNQSSMFNHMIMEAHNRHFKNEHIPVDAFPNPRELGESVLLGSFAWLGLSSGRRWISLSKSVNVGPYLSTPSDIARDYIREKYPTRRRVTTAQYKLISQRIPHPLYAIPQTLENAVYIDIKAAYWQIVKAIGWDVDYFPGKWLAQGEDMSDFPYADNKLARNCLVSFGAPGSANVFSKEKNTVVSIRKHNPHVNMMIRFAVMEVLHGCARDAINAGSAYVHTDGYIASSKHEDAIRLAIAQWGLATTVKHRGRAVIYAAGTYDIANHYHRNSVYRPSSFSNIRTPEHHHWLRERFRRFAVR